jgi:hypothetical protein
MKDYSNLELTNSGQTPARLGDTSLENDFRTSILVKGVIT